MFIYFIKKQILFFSLFFLASILFFAFVNITYGNDDLSSSGFMFSANELSPGEDYTAGPEGNVTSLLEKIVRYLLIIIPTLAVLFMTYGGIKIILAGGDSNEIQNGKKIITYNIIAVAIALLSYSIVQLVLWLIGAAAG